MTEQRNNKQQPRNRGNQQNQRRQQQGQQQAVTPISIAALQEMAQGEVIQIPSFKTGETMAVRVRKIDLTAELTADGAVPNKLQSEVVKQFEQGKSQHQVEEQIKNNINGLDDVGEFLPMINNLVRKALVEPTWDDFEEVYPLTLQQKMAIFTWTMKDIDTFRPSNQRSGPNTNANSKRKNVGSKAK